MNYFKKIKRSFFWKIILLLIIKPIYDFIWVYIINIQAKLTLISWNSKNKEYFNLNNNNQLIVRDNERILDIAKELNRICTKDFLDKSRDEMKSNGVNNQELFDRLEYSIKEKIINFASSDLIVNTAARYMGIFPVLSRIYFYHNIPNPNGENEIQAQKWHKDGMGYKGLDFFISITDINLNNGPFFFLKKIIH